MDIDYSIYLGSEQKNGFTGFLSEKNFFCVVEIFDGFTNEQGEQLMSALTEVGNTAYDTLSHFDSAISELLRAHNIPLDTSIAIGYKKNQTLYLKTVGSGEIYLGRGKVFERIIHGPINAAGKYQKDDFYVFTTSFFTQSLKGITHTKHLLHAHTSIREFPEQIKQTIGAEDDTGAVALFVRITEPQELAINSSHTSRFGISIADFFINKLRDLGSLDGKKKLILGLILVLCIGGFGWNVYRGIQSRGGIQVGQGQRYEDKIHQIETNIAQAKEKTEEVEIGLRLLNEARVLTNTLKKTASKDRSEELTLIQKKITDTESLLIKRTYGEPKEYYDFGLEEKGARGTKLSLFENTAYILNPDGKVYILTLEKKLLKKITLAKKVSNDALVAGYEKNTYVLEPLNGITKIDETEKGKLSIPKETQWNEIVGMQVYNGNIYLLDGGNSVLYKYPVTTDGYGDRVSYFKGTYRDIDTTSSFAIDISVYVATGAVVTKYTAGLTDDFKLVIPGSNVNITKIITHPDQDKLYLWDKKSSVIYISDRDGNYIRQIGASLLGQVNDVEVYKNTAYLLKGAKLYSLEL